MRGKILLCFSILVIAGCGNSEEGMNDSNHSDTPNRTQPINYETPKEQENRMGERDKTIGELGGYPQSEQEYVNEGDKNLNAKNEDRYTNEKTLLIAEYLAKRKEIVQAQVAETDDRIIVAVLTENHEYPNLNEIVEQEVRQVEPNKEIVVYTDENYWERMRNLNGKQLKVDDEITKRLQSFFGNE
ncbi:YhcN/YlaJ family sporulation lipoprotein [Ornithinibacillus contaminans]|uniref:YhcN/YlaJ family sporulation lipoprotein n=1 Tax=Ornithinibacillus contaminans TaxID=694055 RepID=UPI00064DAA25|nr:YhcN/YlaJ family sporulation lipoprotein [Ornithinibacillus contaminans]